MSRLPTSADVRSGVIPSRLHTLGSAPAFTSASTAANSSWTWGFNGDGQLGDGSTVYSRPSPGQVPSLSNIAVLVAGNSHMMAMDLDGGVSVWGRNQEAQLGDGTRINRSTPGLVAAHNGSILLAGGNGFSLGLKADGTVWGWGYNGYGQVGSGTAFYQTTPAQVSIP